MAKSAPRIEPLTRLATGGMAEIWLAREHGAAGLERFVVIKRLLPHLARDEGIVDMFVSEARFVARLVHPNVVQIHELAEDEHGYFLVMEYVAGCTVRELTGALKRTDETLSPDVAVCIVEQACRGAHAAHELTDSSGQPLGLVHRDISPHNLMIGPGGHVKLLDFGIAKATEAAEATHTGSLKGKSGYMSPEQCRAKPLDRRSDIFALGIVAWELLAGARLYQRDSEYASMEAIVSGDTPLLSDARPDLPYELDDIVAKALATDPDARWQTADAMRRALLEAAEHCGLRPSRDALGARMTQLLGDRLEARKHALRDAANPAADHAALRAALVGSEPSLSRTTSGLTTSDDVATVVQRRTSRPPPDDAATRTRAAEPFEDETIIDRHPSGTPAPMPKESAPLPLAPTRDRQASASPTATAAPTVPPSRASTSRVVLILMAAVALVLGAVLLFQTINKDKETIETELVVTTAVDTATSIAPKLEGPALRFAVAPTVEPAVIRQELAPFVDFIARNIGRPVEIEIADSYKDCGDLVASSKVDVALLPPLLFVRTTHSHPELQPVALRLYDGSRASDGYMLVRDDSSYATAAELRDKTVCLVDKTSTTGFLLPRIWMRKAGLDPDKDIKTVLSGDHQAVLRDLIAEKCDAAAVYSGAYLSAREQGIKVGRMRVLAITGRVPQDVFVAAKDVPAELLTKLRELMINFEPKRDINAPRLGEVLGISGFAPYDSAEFDHIRQAAKQEGILPDKPASP